MFQGFYMNVSGMLTQNRNLNVISNNMANVTTPGYLSDRMVQSTFRDSMISRTGNKDKAHPQELGTSAMITRADSTVTDYSMAGFRKSESNLDFAINGKGFFRIQTENGPVYTRNGSFSLDDERYLVMPGVGRVEGPLGPVQLATDRIRVDENGGIFSDDDGSFQGQIAVYDFVDYQRDLQRTDGSTFVANSQAFVTNTPIVQRALTGSNVDATKEMTRMISSQRALQSSANVLKTYDKLMEKITTQLGPA